MVTRALTRGFQQQPPDSQSPWLSILQSVVRLAGLHTPEVGVGVGAGPVGRKHHGSLVGFGFWNVHVCRGDRSEMV